MKGRQTVKKHNLIESFTKRMLLYLIGRLIVEQNQNKLLIILWLLTGFIILFSFN